MKEMIVETSATMVAVVGLVSTHLDDQVPQALLNRATLARSLQDMEQFLLDLKQRNFDGSYDLACKTINHLRKLITRTRWAHAEELMNIIRTEGKQLVAAQPSEYVIGNMVRRVLKIVREEYVRLGGKSEESANTDSLHKMLTSAEIEGEEERYTTPLKDLKTTVMEAVSEYIEEMDGSVQAISSQALEQIHSNEVILTLGKSRTVEAFLKLAAKKRKFHVIVVEGSPLSYGHELAVSLAKENIETTVITNSAVFAMMSRVNKVLIGTHSILANGGIRAVNGAHLVALAAREHAVPFVVLGAMFKLCLLHYSDIAGSETAFNRLETPQNVLDYYEAGSEELYDVEVYCPRFDYVPPDLVTLFISNIGGNAPTYMYRLLSEMYHPNDHVL